ncbi:hypothetical protein THASP1DRAFT_24604 [Thamnocephalis sphaerospora]|uniref:Myb-like domain-containing protein n=1 Tax=Thamnocephalis sphaerospora TaxID=78915 RepID=A0A4P9XMQ9_9FUNG|nr:hypothetical protein THASP1DRAFT_24604 [Thamnocephalis sphaerospora]|eukprot:RKP07204.1 hypothetical protein THASP1DRAFT_24604 [Thamnocephalis sphaerospora]
MRQTVTWCLPCRHGGAVSPVLAHGACVRGLSFRRCGLLRMSTPKAPVPWFEEETNMLLRVQAEVWREYESDRMITGGRWNEVARRLAATGVSKHTRSRKQCYNKWLRLQDAAGISRVAKSEVRSRPGSASPHRAAADDGESDGDGSGRGGDDAEGDVSTDGTEGSYPVMLGSNRRGDPMTNPRSVLGNGVADGASPPSRRSRTEHGRGVEVSAIHRRGNDVSIPSGLRSRQQHRATGWAQQGDTVNQSMLSDGRRDHGIRNGGDGLVTRASRSTSEELRHPASGGDGGGMDYTRPRLLFPQESAASAELRQVVDSELQRLVNAPTYGTRPLNGVGTADCCAGDVCATDCRPRPTKRIRHSPGHNVHDYDPRSMAPPPPPPGARYTESVEPMPVLLPPPPNSSVPPPPPPHHHHHHHQHQQHHHSGVTSHQIQPLPLPPPPHSGPPPSTSRSADHVHAVYEALHREQDLVRTLLTQQRRDVEELQRAYREHARELLQIQMDHLAEQQRRAEQYRKEERERDERWWRTLDEYGTRQEKMIKVLTAALAPKSSSAAVCVPLASSPKAVSTESEPTAADDSAETGLSASQVAADET